MNEPLENYRDSLLRSAASMRQSTEKIRQGTEGLLAGGDDASILLMVDAAGEELPMMAALRRVEVAYRQLADAIAEQRAGLFRRAGEIRRERAIRRSAEGGGL